MQPENRILRLPGLCPRESATTGAGATGIVDTRHGQVHAGSPAATKVAVFAALFGARPGDVRALR
jgi:hypothetical protein